MRDLIAIVALALFASGCNQGGGGAPAPSSGGTAGVASGDCLTIDQIMSARVVFEDLTPGLLDDGEPAQAPAGAPTTSAALFTWSAGRVLDLQVVVERPEGWADPHPDLAQAKAQLNARWRLETPAGVLLQEGAFELPEVCDCGETDDHVRGCVRTSHTARFRLDLPRLAPDACLVITDDTGVVLGDYDIALTP